MRDGTQSYSSAHANAAKYGQLIKFLENTYTKESNEYPNTIDKAHAYLLNYRAQSINQPVSDDESIVAYRAEHSGRRTGCGNRKNSTRGRRWA